MSREFQSDVSSGEEDNATVRYESLLEDGSPVDIEESGSDLDEDSDTAAGNSVIYSQPSRNHEQSRSTRHEKSRPSGADESRSTRRNSQLKHKFGGHANSFGTVEDSLSTIQGSGGGPSQTEVAMVYQELQNVNAKMKQEFKLLHERDKLLKEKEARLEERERILSSDKAEFETLVVNEIKRRMTQREKEHQLAMEHQDLQLKDKTREHKRLKDNFDTLKTANDTLRKELDAVQSQYSKLEKQSNALQARLLNLQRRREQSDLKESEFLPPELLKKKTQDKKTVKDKVPQVTSKPSMSNSAYEILGLLLEWVSEVNLRYAITEEPTKPLDGFTTPEFLQEKCFKVLPPLVEILRELPTGNQALMLPCLQFLYWALLHTENSQSYQRTSLSSTLRRLGAELYKPRTVKFSEDEVGKLDPMAAKPARIDKPKEGLYFRSSNLHIRFLSSLIILQTITQVDHVAHVFEVLKADLKSEAGKELFLHYQATPIFLHFLKPSCKAFMNTAMDVYLHLTMESPMLASFLQSCSNETWFRVTSMLFRMPHADEKLLEKISIVLQKLSKIKNNKRHFEVFGLSTACQEMLRTIGTSNAFLTLNLKSILFNLHTRTATAAASSVASSSLANSSVTSSQFTVS